MAMVLQLPERKGWKTYMLKTEVLIIGGGALGTAVARELSRYKVEATLVEREVDFGWGSTKANMSIVCQGADSLEFRKEYRRSRLVQESIPMMGSLCDELSVPFNRVGELAVFFNNDGRAKYEKMKARSESIGITTHRFVDRDELRRMEPNIAKEAAGALYDPNIAVTDPVRLTIALAENARQNGVELITGVEVKDIAKGTDGFEVKTSQGNISCEFIVNAAGTSVDKVAAMINADDFVVYPIRGYVAVLDKKVSDLVNHEVHARPEAPGESNIITPTVHDNLFIGTPMKLARRGERITTAEMEKVTLSNAQRLVPDISDKDIINSFSGFLMFRNWELGWHECVVSPSRNVSRFINVSIGYPGVSATPATAKEVVKLLSQEGLKLEEKPDFNPYRRAIVDFSELSNEGRQELIARDSRYGHVVCRCETVTEGEIVEAIKQGATTLDGVKFRTRAGMGRCHSGFCLPRVINILSRELGISQKDITKNGCESRQLLFESKELIGGGNSEK
jgi:glycerol-3-phosphate dehydrogenase